MKNIKTALLISAALSVADVHAQNWSLGGNAGTSAGSSGVGALVDGSFIGTTDNSNLVLGTAWSKRAIIDLHTNMWGGSYTAPMPDGVNNCFAWGTGNTFATAGSSAAFGYQNSINAAYCFATGQWNTLGPAANYGLVSGYSNTNNASAGLITGQYNSLGQTAATGVALGLGNHNDASVGFVTGQWNTISATATGAASFGYFSQNAAPWGLITGQENVLTATAISSVAMGTYNSASGTNSFALGWANNAANDRSMAIGAGASTTADNQFAANFAGGYSMLGGNVGIGTGSPRAKLDVAGNINAVGQSLFTYNPPFSDPAPGVPNAIKANGGISTSNGQSVFSLGNFSDPASGISYAIKVGGGGIAVNGTSFFNGNVGVGTTSPQAKLEVVSGTLNSSGLKLTNLTSVSPAAAVPTATIGVDAVGNVVNVANYLSSFQGTVSAATMTNKFNLPVTTDTRYGDGSGTAKLDLMTPDGDGGGGFGVIQAPFISSPVVWLYSNQHNAFTVAIKNNYTGGHPELAGENMVPALQVRETGLIGINTTAPQARLDIVGNIRIADGSQASGKVLTCDANGVASWQLPTGGGGGAITMPAGGNGQLQFNSNGSFAAGPNLSWDDASGRLAIGQPTTAVTTTDNCKLNVNGSIRANKLVVNTTGADFVFSPCYKLKPLAEVESYVRVNQHLPDVAPAAEMQKDGVEVGESQAKLLQKIEELTLYIIQQEKRIEKLESHLKRKEHHHG